MQATQKMYAAVKRLNLPTDTKKSTSSLSKFDRDSVARYLQNPIANEKQIRNLSNYIYNVNPQYKRIIWYFALMPTYSYVLEPIDIPLTNFDKQKYTKQYIKILQSIENMNLRHELINVSKVAYKDDVYYGYIHESKDSFFLQKMDADYCRISSIEDGVYNYAFDFSYFDVNKEALEHFPIEFKVKYQRYKDTKERWIELDSDMTACFKVQEELNFPLPPFNTMFESIFDLDEYKKIKKARTKLDNFMLLIQKIPMDEKNPEINKFLVDLELAAQFHNMAEAVVNDGVGIVTSPLSIESVKMEKTKSDSDTVAQALREVHNDSGVSQFIFNSDKNTGVGLNYSITSDEQVSFALLRQYERWVNRRIKKQSGQYKFQLKFLDMTVFNQDKLYEKYLKAAQFGIPVINEIGAALNLSPLDLYNKAKLEVDVLGLHDMLRPLKSSHTQNGKDEEAGAPRKDDSDITPSTEVTRNNE